jgi:tryptophan 2,3-dioxygenase
MEIAPETLEHIRKLSDKYSNMGQDMNSYLEGLLHTEYLTYWDYIHLDTLMTLQNPRTHFPDEQIFIMYHQITELYFRLILLELDQISALKEVSKDAILKHLKRVTGYYKNLTNSFDVMVNGMDPQQFLKFRMALLPASGFQSAQYRMIEMMCTDMLLMVPEAQRNTFTGNESIAEMYPHIYWKYGNIELKSGKKTLTLTMFEDKYDKRLLELIQAHSGNNLRRQYHKLSTEDQSDITLREHLRQLDLQANVFWPLSHYKSAVRYLHRDLEDIKATGGTNWQKYLPPRFQRVIFFPELWSSHEQEEWGKGWVLELFNTQVEQFWK